MGSSFVGHTDTRLSTLGSLPARRRHGARNAVADVTDEDRSTLIDKRFESVGSEHMAIGLVHVGKTRTLGDESSDDEQDPRRTASKPCSSRKRPYRHATHIDSPDSLPRQPRYDTGHRAATRVRQRVDAHAYVPLACPGACATGLLHESLGRQPAS